jgi:hypothetical protein
MISVLKEIGWLVLHLAKDEHIHVSSADKWRLCVPEIKVESGSGVLASEGRPQHDTRRVVVKGLIHDWTHHVGENVVAHKVHRVLNDHDGEEDELMHSEGHHLVVVVQIRLSKFDVTIVDYWVKVSICVQLEICLEIDIKIFENQLNSALAWQDVRVDRLHGINLPFLDGGEVNLDQGLVVASGQVELDVLDIEKGLLVSDIGPINLPREHLKQHTEFIMVLCGKLEVRVHILWQEYRHCILQLVEGVLLHSNLHSWIHPTLVGGLYREVAVNSEKELAHEQGDERLRYN